MRTCLLRPAAAPLAALALVACGSESTGLGINLVPQEQVAEMAQPAWQQILSETAPSGNAAYQQRAQEISSRLLAAAGEDPAKWEVRVFEGNEANAFALPNAKIGIFEGMFGVAENDAQLAAVLAHEVAHVQEEHSTERVNSEMATQLGVQLAGAVVGSATGVSPQAAAGLLGAGAQYGLVLPYGRNQELEADSRGLTLMAKAGYDPRAAVELWQNMRQAGGDRPPTFLSTHPGPEQRIAQLQAQMPEALEVYQTR
ncbi:M48 family metallopeptidase [Desertibaculum subflavum]|uniref:M48 family metallopeptidase n=1 Tax=Desertibaculum subflavum TaxID=2268458 RepID=UPI000E667CAD